MGNMQEDFVVGSVVERREPPDLLAVAGDDLLEHVIRSCPNLFGVLGASVEHELFFGLAVLGKADDLVLISLEVAVPAEGDRFLF